MKIISNCSSFCPLVTATKINDKNKLKDKFTNKVDLSQFYKQDNSLIVKFLVLTFDGDNHYSSEDIMFEFCYVIL